MNKFQKLAQLNQDIELLENAGLYKAASVLHKKFVKEAQAKSARDLMTELNTLAKNPGPDFDNLVSLVERNLDSSPPYNADEIEAIKRTIQNGKNQKNLGTFSTTVAPKNQTLSAYPLSSDNPLSSAKPNDPDAPTGKLSNQVQAEQFDIAFRNLGDTIQTGKENMDIQAKYRMTPQENETENQLYSSTINEIKKLLATGNETQRNYARGLYQNTRQKFKNLKRQYLYDQQYAKIDRNPNKKQ